MALRFSVLPSCANAIALAPDVRFSINEDEADSERSNTAANGATSAPNSASNRATSADASSLAARTAEGKVSDRSAMRGTTAGTTAARYAPEWRRRTLAATRSGEIRGLHGRTSDRHCRTIIDIFK